MGDPESGRSIITKNNQLGSNTVLFVGVIENMKKVLQGILSPWQNSQVKQTYISQISSFGKVSKDKIEDFFECLETGEISQQEIKKSIEIFLNARAILIHSDLSHPDVFMKKGKKVRIQKYVNDIEESDKYILAYGIEKGIITLSQLQYLHFTDGDNMYLFMNTYSSSDLLQEYLEKLISPSCIN